MDLKEIMHAEQPPAADRRRGAFVPQALCALGIAMWLLAGCATAPGRTSPGPSGVIAPPSLPMPRLLAVADAGRASLSTTVQVLSDPQAGVAYLLAGHQVLAPVVSSPWADRLVAVDRTTGAQLWSYSASGSGSVTTPDHLSGIVANSLRHLVMLAGAGQAVALNARDGTVASSVALPADVNCGEFPAPTARPTLDTAGRVLFPCNASSAQLQAVGILVDFTAHTATRVPAPPIPPIGAPHAGILGHQYAISDDGLRVLSAMPTQNPLLLAALPLDVASLGNALWVEQDTTGQPTGRLYLAGIGAQVLIVEDGDPATLTGQTGPIWAAVLAERAVALSIAPSRFADGKTLPVLPAFLVTPGQYAHTACFGAATPNAPGTATTRTSVSGQPGGIEMVDLVLSVRDGTGHETASRHWTVQVAHDGNATITRDAGSADPFSPLPPTPCPI
jgi:hypothetical protein